MHTGWYVLVFLKLMPTNTYNPEVTRKQLLEAAAKEIWANGFRAASLGKILSQIGVTKGALYYHFKNKQELGYAVIDEVLRADIQNKWIKPLEQMEDPIEGIKDLLTKSLQQVNSQSMQKGCPLNNLAQEMSPIDEGFREKIETLFHEWRQAISLSLEKGKQKGNVRTNVDS